MANVTRLLHGAPEGASFLQQLDLKLPEKTSLELARGKVRDALRLAFSTAARATFGAPIAPRFFTQGSYAYHTINRPAFPPKQQKDLDDGVYLPLTFMKGTRPSLAADAYFQFVDGILLALAEKEGWSFSTRPTCARLGTGRDAHVDVPLYAIPDAEFRMLSKAVAKARGLPETEEIDFMTSRRDADRWSALPSDQVLLAHREDDWKASDPRQLHDWFLGAVDIHTEQLRRVCRYLKAWRDFQGEALADWSSICLMVCAFEVYEERGAGNMDRRDDLALLAVAQRLPGLLQGKIMNPTNEGEALCSRLKGAARSEAIARAEALAVAVRGAVDQGDARACVDGLRSVLGPRVPDRLDLVQVDAASVAAVRREPARIMPAPIVGRSISG